MELSDESIEFLRDRYTDVDNFLFNEKLLSLKAYKRHFYTNTYDHSVRVAVGAAILAEWLHADIQSAIRIGLVHDMCFVDYYKKNAHKGWYLFYHPIEAAENAKQEFNITQREQKAIKAHMFPLCFTMLTSKEALCLTLSDKAIAIYEGTYRIRFIRNMLGYIGLRELHAY